MAECKYLDGKNTIILNGVLQTVLNQNLAKEKFFFSPGTKKRRAGMTRRFAALSFKIRYVSRFWLLPRERPFRQASSL